MLARVQWILTAVTEFSWRTPLISPEEFAKFVANRPMLTDGGYGVMSE